MNLEYYFKFFILKQDSASAGVVWESDISPDLGHLIIFIELSSIDGCSKMASLYYLDAPHTQISAGA